jgi:hypothetical protein
MGSHRYRLFQPWMDVSPAAQNEIPGGCPARKAHLQSLSLRAERLAVSKGYIVAIAQNACHIHKVCETGRERGGGRLFPKGRMSAARRRRIPAPE